MKLNDSAVREFQVLVQKETGRELTHAQAESEAHMLMQLLETLLIPKSDDT